MRLGAKTSILVAAAALVAPIAIAGTLSSALEHSLLWRRSPPSVDASSLSFPRFRTPELAVLNWTCLCSQARACLFLRSYLFTLDSAPCAHGVGTKESGDGQYEYYALVRELSRTKR